MRAPVAVRSWGTAPGFVVAALSALLVLGPLLGRGFVLSYDMVFVPEQPITRGLLGLDSFVARAVPSDLLVAVASLALPADVVQKVILLATLVLGGWGASRLATGPAGQVAAALAYIWSPFVYERLVIGHWSLLVAWAALPFAVRSVTCVAARRHGAVPALVLALSLAGFGSPTGGVLVAGAAVAVAAYHHSRRAVATTVIAGIVANLPWVVPSLLLPGGIPADPDGVAAFAARADTPLGVGVSLLAGGGIWNAQVVPPGRDSWLLAPFVLAVVLVGLLGTALAWHAPGQVVRRPVVKGLVVAGLIGWAVAMAGAFEWTRPLVEAAVTSLPGGGLLRDGQKWVLPLVLLLAVGSGALVERLVSRVTDVGWRLVAVVPVLLLPLAVTPVLGWGAADRLERVSYPADWARVRALVRADPQTGAVLVLPWQPYRAYHWNSGTTGLAPAPRMFDRRVLLDDDLPLPRLVVEGEDARVAALDPVVTSGSPLVPALAEAGVRFVLLEHRTGISGVDRGRLSGAERVYLGQDLELFVVPDPAPVAEAGPPTLPVAIAAAMAFTVAVGALLLVIASAARGALLRFRHSLKARVREGQTSR